jgi:F420-dependent oxidoreductase-like protein
VKLRLMIEGQEGVTWQEWTALARACEEAGIDALFRSDHYLSFHRGPDGGALDAWGVVTALAASTTTLRLGVMVSPVTFRHPSVLGRLAVTADHVSGGRVELGIGGGWNEREHTAHGFPFPPVGERLALLEEQVEIVVRQWTEEEFDFTGRHYRLEHCTALPKPLQRPHLPLILGGAAKPRAARLAARFADEYNSAGVSPEVVVERRRTLDEACERAGRDPGTLRRSVMIPAVVGRDEREVEERLRRVAELTGREPAAMRAPGRLVGTLEEAAEQLDAYAAVGVDTVYLQHLDHGDLEPVRLIGELQRQITSAAGPAASAGSGSASPRT